MIAYYAGLAVRKCARQPAVAALVVVTIAIGIASFITALAIFSALEGQPIPGVSSSLYVITMDARPAIRTTASAYSAPDSLLSLRDAKAIIAAHRASAQVALAQTSVRVSSRHTGRAATVIGLEAYGSVLRTMGIPLLYGRQWTANEQATGAPVVVISSGLAQRLFGSADAVGRSVEMGARLFRIVGVTARWMPRTQFFLRNSSTGGDQVVGSDFQAFLPVQSALDAGIGPSSSGQCEGGAMDISFGAVDVKNCRWLELWVSLPNSSAVSAYSRFLDNYADVQHETGRFAYTPHAKLYGTMEWMTINHVIPGDVTLDVVLAVAFLGLCAVNTTGLLTARFRRRRAEIAVRRALGATRRQVITQLLVESGLLGLAGGAAGLPLTMLGLWIVRQQPVSYAQAARFSPTMFVTLLILSLLIGMLVGGVPAWRMCGLSPATLVKRA